MREEFLYLQQTQLVKQKEELELLVKGLGKEVTSALIDVLPKTILSSAENLQSSLGSPSRELAIETQKSKDNNEVNNDNGSENDDEEDDDVVNIPEEIIPDILSLKDLYLPLWGNNNFPILEIVSVVASATVEYALLDASIDNNQKGYPILHPLHDNESFKNIHWVIFTKDSQTHDSFYLMKIRLNSASGKTCKLKFPSNKITEICESRKSVNVTLNELTKFEISSTSLRLDNLSTALLQLWDAHLAWVAQKIITSATLHENLQFMLRMIFQQGSFGQENITTENNNNTNNNNNKKKKKKVINYGWLSQRYELLSCLSNIIKESKSSKYHYDQTIEKCLIDISTSLKKWGYFPGSTNSDTVNHDPTNLPWYLLSKKVLSLVENIFDPFQNYLSYRENSPLLQQNGKLNFSQFHDSLLRRHESLQSTIYPILKDIFMEFVDSLNIGKIFSQLYIEPLMQMCHDRWVTAFAHCEAYPWILWCQENQQWVNFMEVSKILFFSFFL